MSLLKPFKEYSASLILALQFFSRLPIPLDVYSPSRQTQILHYLPWVGLLFGLITYSLFASVVALSNLFVPGIFNAIGPNELAFGALIFTVWLSGALHLDGVADSADAGLGAIKQPRKALQIMHDSRIGTGGAVALLMLLLGKWIALSGIFTELLNVDSESTSLPMIILLVFIPFIARVMPLVLLKTCAIATQSDNHRRLFAALKTPVVLFYLSTVVLILIWLGLQFSVLTSVGLATVLLIAWLWLKRFANNLLNGVNGDLLGLSIELSELLLLFACLFIFRLN